MRAQLEQRLGELREEYASGQRMLSELETRQATVKETLLRISGAIQVLEEEIAKADPDAGQPTTAPAVQVTNGVSAARALE